MAFALCVDQNVDISPTEVTLTLYCAFGGPEVNDGQGALDYIHVKLAPNDSKSTIATKIAAAVSTHATTRGWVVTGNMIIPSYDKA